MRASVGGALIGAGTALGVGAVVAASTGLHITLPAALLTIALYKLAFGAAAGLMFTGAILRRHAIARSRDRVELNRGDGPAA